MASRWYNKADAPAYTRMSTAAQPEWEKELENDMPTGSTPDHGESGGRKTMQSVRNVRSQAVQEVSTLEAGHISEGEAALRFVLAGNATLTLRSRKTGERYTYKVRKASNDPARAALDGDTWFVTLLTGPDNTNDFTYIGIVRDGQFRTTRKSKLTMQSKPVFAFAWMLDKLVKHAMPKDAEIWHAGQCGRCGRKLTVPSSINTGFGPECAAKLGEAF